MQYAAVPEPVLRNGGDELIDAAGFSTSALELGSRVQAFLSQPHLVSPISCPGFSIYLLPGTAARCGLPANGANGILPLSLNKPLSKSVEPASIAPAFEPVSNMAMSDLDTASKSIEQLGTGLPTQTDVSITVGHILRRRIMSVSLKNNSTFYTTATYSTSVVRMAQRSIDGVLRRTVQNDAPMTCRELALAAAARYYTGDYTAGYQAHLNPRQWRGDIDYLEVEGRCLSLTFVPELGSKSLESMIISLVDRRTSGVHILDLQHSLSPANSYSTSRVSPQYGFSNKEISVPLRKLFQQEFSNKVSARELSSIFRLLTMVSFPSRVPAAVANEEPGGALAEALESLTRSLHQINNSSRLGSTSMTIKLLSGCSGLIADREVVLSGEACFGEVLPPDSFRKRL
ncbi:hypothetical protein BDK51DRAFT_47443 [Blyttiomyces helicus]|uniref:Uncharacterized protein n=1 Tax=Blyttiomyces helicus TaxID=388810 RepID=A0A4P9W6B4_9FUNG|nr:hypothetical protein BDK51DRAFT_47443 [Blyttiomyces helicus]|eukprot:RKO86290.1 hypothetical protein BDK51DRAFT_47443 [Blyttiomyces helicus]